MSFNPAPTGYFPSIDLATGIGGVSGVFIPYSDLESFKSNTTGDVREFVYSFVEKLSDVWLNLAAGDRSQKMVITRTSSIIDDNTLRKTYTVRLDLNLGTMDVTDE